MHTNKTPPERKPASWQPPATCSWRWRHDVPPTMQLFSGTVLHHGQPQQSASHFPFLGMLNRVLPTAAGSLQITPPKLTAPHLWNCLLLLDPPPTWRVFYTGQITGNRISTVNPENWCCFSQKTIIHLEAANHSPNYPSFSPKCPSFFTQAHSGNVHVGKWLSLPNKSMLRRRGHTGAHQPSA